jgi:hypothetical protein
MEDWFLGEFADFVKSIEKCKKSLNFEYFEE